jgi:hypothetical protein
MLGSQMAERKETGRFSIPYMLFLFLEPVLKFVKIDHHFRPKKSIDTM